MMGHRAKLSGGDEWDVASQRARRLLCWCDKPGATHAVKKRMSSRARKNAKQHIKKIIARFPKTLARLAE